MLHKKRDFEEEKENGCAERVQLEESSLNVNKQPNKERWREYEICELFLAGYTIKKHVNMLWILKAIKWYQHKKHSVCLDTRGAQFGQPIGVGGCHHYLGSQVMFLLKIEF